ncbi:hypothetical protein AYR61_06960 [Secundilactobacillus paracollinoides]|nr:hypothetical protein AYR61_06960 [Secundilactobacillus paracollinoides]
MANHSNPIPLSLTREQKFALLLIVVFLIMSAGLDIDMFDFKADQAFRYGLIRRPQTQLTELQEAFIKGIGRIQ